MAYLQLEAVTCALVYGGMDLNYPSSFFICYWFYIFFGVCCYLDMRKAPVFMWVGHDVRKSDAAIVLDFTVTWWRGLALITCKIAKYSLAPESA